MLSLTTFHYPKRTFSISVTQKPLTNVYICPQKIEPVEKTEKGFREKKQEAVGKKKPSESSHETKFLTSISKFLNFKPLVKETKMLN